MIASPLKWAGGKTRVMPQLLEHLPKADWLIEPFVGGASIFLNTDYRRYVLADINTDLINLYRVIKISTDDLIRGARYLFENGNSADAYAHIRTSFNSSTPRGLSFWEGCIYRAAAFLYLNRHGFNGLCRYNLSGNFNVPYGHPKRSPYLPEKEIRLFAEKANDTKALFLGASFELSLKFAARRDAVIYCDPPYLPASKTASFARYHTSPFTADHHRQLVDALLNINRKCGTKVVISNSDTDETREIYRAFRLHNIEARRSIGASKDSRKDVPEVIGTLKTCDCCGRAGGGYCPDCGPVMGDTTYAEMYKNSLWIGFDPAASEFDDGVPF